MRFRRQVDPHIKGLPNRCSTGRAQARQIPPPLRHGASLKGPNGPGTPFHQPATGLPWRAASSPMTPTEQSIFSYDEQEQAPYEMVGVEPTGDIQLPNWMKARIFVHTAHDGALIPARYCLHPSGKPLVDPVGLEKRFIRERDWGANLIAQKVSEALGLPGFARVRIARVLFDFNRFPGSTPPNVNNHLERLAINRPFSDVLSHAQKLDILERYYDTISERIESEWLQGTQLMIGIHTYDERNPSQTQRPALSIMSSVGSYMRDKRMPFGFFDPLYPDRLAESTCSRVLRDRISLNLERNGFRVAHNYPYALPEGSMEVRAQVWFFFDFLKRHFENANPQTKDEPAYQRVWTMLLNTNLRLHEAESLRGYLHRLRKVNRKEVASFRQSQIAYEHIRAHMLQRNVETAYRRSKNRPSSLAIEVRKDLVCDFDETTGRPLPITAEIDERATLIGKVIAGAITTYLDLDRSFL